jgi:hypothetical protein
LLKRFPIWSNRRFVMVRLDIVLMLMVRSTRTMTELGSG